jgi:benzodiazapine receptor
MNPRVRSLLGLAFSLGLCLAVSAVGGMVTATSVGTWYQGLVRPPLNPPDWIFAPVWSALYVLMALAAWRVWKIAGVAGARRELGMFAIQLGLNLGWSVVFFGLRLPGWAFGEMIVLFAAIVATLILFWQRDRLAGALIVPYVAWVGFALYLNGAIWWLN